MVVKCATPRSNPCVVVLIIRKVEKLTYKAMISKEALEEFKQIWREEYGEEISDDFALERATALLSAMDKIYRPIKKNWLADYGKRNPK